MADQQIDRPKSQGFGLICKEGSDRHIFLHSGTARGLAAALLFTYYKCSELRRSNEVTCSAHDKMQNSCRSSMYCLLSSRI